MIARVLIQPYLCCLLPVVHADMQGQALMKAKPTVKCVVVGNPANTNANILVWLLAQRVLDDLSCSVSLSRIVRTENSSSEDKEAVVSDAFPLTSQTSQSDSQKYRQRADL